MRKTKITGTVQRRKRRAVELFSAECNFRPKTIPNKRAYSRKGKQRKSIDDLG